MKNSIKSLVALAAFGAATFAAQAQPAVKILVVDMAKLYDTHYKTVEQNAKIQEADQKAQQEVEKMNQDGNTIVAEYTKLVEQVNNPTLSADAKKKAEGEAMKQRELIETKQNEVRTFIQNTRNSLQQRLQTFRSLMLEEISKLASEVAKRKGATILIDKAGPSAIGISNIIYSDAGYEITDEVMAEINKSRPAGAPTAPAAAPAPAATAPAQKAAPAAASPSINVPGIGTKK